MISGNKQQKNEAKLEKRSFILLGLMVPIWKIHFCFMFLRLSLLPRWRELPQTAMCFLEWLERLKCRATLLYESKLVERYI